MGKNIKSQLTGHIGYEILEICDIGDSGFSFKFFGRGDVPPSFRGAAKGENLHRMGGRIVHNFHNENKPQQLKICFCV